MCGIAGIFQLKDSQRDEQQIANLVSMTRAMRHRGPDDEGYIYLSKSDGIQHLYGVESHVANVMHGLHSVVADLNSKIISKVAMGHRRLSILDLSQSGHQPMASSDGRYWIAFNGEIYNYIELRDELRTFGYNFSSNSDTEVVLNAFSLWGVDCFNRFNGDWALLIYDLEENSVVVSRDRFGIKPLYFAKTHDRIVFSSEIKGLLAHHDLNPIPDLSYLGNYLKHGASEWCEETPFSGVFRFPIASYAKIDLNKDHMAYVPVKYWELECNDSHVRFSDIEAQEYASQYYDLLLDAVRIRLRSDVSVGCSLSGGLDSSSIVYLVNEILSSQAGDLKPRTFSLTFEEKEHRSFDESAFVELLDRQLSINTKKTSLSQVDSLECLKKIIYFWESPPDGLGLAGFVTTKLARDSGFKVTLDGQGADEQLAGYRGYFGAYLKGIAGPKRLAEAFFLLTLHARSRAAIREICLALLPSTVARIIRAFFSLSSRSLGNSNLNQVLKKSISTGLVNLLHYGDSRSMSFSIESRMPFMDHRLVEFNAKVPAAYKIHRGWTKYYARLAFRNRLPNEIVWRKDKIGWAVPYRSLFRNELGDISKQLMSNSELLEAVSSTNQNRADCFNKNHFIRKFNVALFDEIFIKKN